MLSLMETCGIITEFNPFHLGHRELIRQIKATLSERTAIVAVMSGHFTQRGEPSLCDLSYRVSSALKEGIDLIIEIPVNHVLCSAETFAASGINLLLATGVVRNLAYGTEDNNSSDSIKEIAEFLAYESPEFKEDLARNIRLGMGFAAARQEAVAKNIKNDKAAQILGNSNSILAVEYEKALIISGKTMPTFALPLYDKNKLSAANLRQAAYKAMQGKAGTEKARLIQLLHPYMTPASLSELIAAIQAEEGPVFLNDFNEQLYSQAIWRNLDQLKDVQGMQNGLAERFCKQLTRDDSTVGRSEFSDWLNLIASRNFPLSRVKRAFFSALLNLQQNDSTTAEINFIRVLGFSKRGQILLKYMKNTATVPVITRSADWQLLNHPDAIRERDLSFAAGNLWKSRLNNSQAREETRQIVKHR